MEHIDAKMFRDEVRMILQDAVSGDYANYILDSENADRRTFIDDVQTEVEETSGWMDEGIYNDSDIRYAIGRVFMRRLDIIV